MTHKITKASLILYCLLLFPLSLNAQVTTSYLVNWEPNPETENIIEYIVYRSTNPNVPGNAIATVGAATFSYEDTDLEKGVAYYYRVVARNGSGDNSPYSEPVSGLTIPNTADASTRSLCQVTSVDLIGSNSFDVNWSTADPTTGFIQFDSDMTLDSMSAWDEQYSSSHTSPLANLLAPMEYYLRAVSYDDSGNMIISAVDSFTISGEEPQPLSTPVVSIYPVPFHPDMGSLTFNNLPAEGSVAVYGGDGIMVWEKKIETETVIVWDGTNMHGSQVMSGVYYALVKDKSGTIIDKRPIMIVN